VRAAFLEHRAYECFLINDTDEAVASLQQAIELSRDWAIRCGWVVCCVLWRARFTSPVVTPTGRR
jgi:hypothetical protein